METDPKTKLKVILIIFSFVNDIKTWLSIRSLCKFFYRRSWNASSCLFDTTIPLRLSFYFGYDEAAKSLLKDKSVHALKTKLIIGNKKIYNLVIDDIRFVLKDILFDTINYMITNGNYKIKLFNIFNFDWFYFINKTNVLFLCTSKGYLDLLIFFFDTKRINPFIQKNVVIKTACQFGQTSIVKYLLEDWRIDLCVDDNYPLRVASKNGHLEIVKLLLSNTKVNPCESALFWAIKKGHTNVVIELLKQKKIDPTKWKNRACSIAFKKNYFKILKIILDDERVKSNISKRKMAYYLSKTIKK